jgi:hypothetical protein
MLFLEQAVVNRLDLVGKLAQVGQADHPPAALEGVELRRTVRSASRSPGFDSSSCDGSRSRRARRRPR